MEITKTVTVTHYETEPAQCGHGIGVKLVTAPPHHWWLWFPPLVQTSVSSASPCRPRTNSLHVLCYCLNGSNYKGMMCRFIMNHLKCSYCKVLRSSWPQNVVLAFYWWTWICIISEVTIRLQWISTFVFCLCLILVGQKNIILIKGYYGILLIFLCK